jgi:hypothetical protein
MTAEHYTVKGNGQVVQLPPKNTYLLPTGLEIKIRPVAPGVVDLVRNGGAKPKPPIELVPIYDGNGKEVGKTPEVNMANDNYIEQMRAHRQEREEKLVEVLLELGTDFTPPEGEIVSYKETLLALDPTMKFQSSDKVFYLLNIALTNQQEIQRLLEAIQRRNQPTEAAIAEAAEAFRG